MVKKGQKKIGRIELHFFLSLAYVSMSAIWLRPTISVILFLHYLVM